MKALLWLTCVAAMLIAGAFHARGQAANEGNPYVLNVEVGEAFPVHPLRDLEGKARSVADYRGKKLVLHIFASW
jgi:hypothetical protein